MSIHFWPTLKIIACARLARGILYTFDLENLKKKYISLTTNDGIARQMENISNDILRPFSQSPLLAPNENQEEKHRIMMSIRNQLVSVLSIMGFEVAKWYIWHKRFLEGDDIDLRNKLTWFSFGIIDNIKTAQNFIQDEHLSDRERFLLACMYYFEDEVKMLYEEMSEDDIDFVYDCCDETKFMEVWLSTLNRGETLNWATISLSDRKRGLFFESNHLGVRNYFTKLKGGLMKNRCVICSLKEMEIHHFDMYTLFSQTSIVDMNLIFKELRTKHLVFVFKCLLCWPLQSAFLDFAMKFQKHINIRVFFQLLKFFLLDRIRYGWKDYQYDQLLEDFLNIGFSDYFDAVVEAGPIFDVLNYVITASKPIDVHAYQTFIGNLDI